MAEQSRFYCPNCHQHFRQHDDSVCQTTFELRELLGDDTDIEWFPLQGSDESLPSYHKNGLAY